MVNKGREITIGCLFVILLLGGCATQQGYHGAGVGALTGGTAGALLDSSNPWRGAVIGGSLGASLGGALTDSPRYSTPYYDPAYYGNHPSSPYSYERYSPYPQGYRYHRDYSHRPRYSHSTANQAGQGAVVGGLTGATAGALLDDGNAWRGAAIGGFLGSFFGWGVGSINSGPRVPVLRP